jgi:hypothetical protein
MLRWWIFDDDDLAGEELDLCPTSPPPSRLTPIQYADLICVVPPPEVALPLINTWLGCRRQEPPLGRIVRPLHHVWKLVVQLVQPVYRSW